MDAVVEAMAAACFVGLDPWRLVDEPDSLRSRLVARVIERTAELQRKRDETLARMIISELSKAMKRGRSK